MPIDFAKCLIFQCFLFLLLKQGKFLRLENQWVVNLTPCDRLPQKSDKERIAMHLEALGIDWKDAEQAKGAIKSITQLEPTEDNFPEIEARLSIRVQEKRDADANH